MLENQRTNIFCSPRRYARNLSKFSANQFPIKSPMVLIRIDGEYFVFLIYLVSMMPIGCSFWACSAFNEFEFVRKCFVVKMLFAVNLQQHLIEQHIEKCSLAHAISLRSYCKLKKKFCFQHFMNTNFQLYENHTS